MKFTREQFDNLGPFYLDEFPIDDKDQDHMFKVFNSLPEELQGEVLSHGFNDTVVRENIMGHLCDKIYQMSVEDYYASYYAKVYFTDGTIVYP
jgi:hypothetical protein